jgi:hypothetical protein
LSPVRRFSAVRRLSAVRLGRRWFEGERLLDTVALLAVHAL